VPVPRSRSRQQTATASETRQPVSAMNAITGS
jgi:hypothetical protein